MIIAVANNQSNVKINTIQAQGRYIQRKFAIQWMSYTLYSHSIYPEIITHTTLNLMTKLTDYPSPAKQEAKIEAQRRNAEAKVLQKNAITND